jgi:hypothetical protein
MTKLIILMTDSPSADIPTMKRASAERPIHRNGLQKKLLPIQVVDGLLCLLLCLIFN